MARRNGRELAKRAPDAPAAQGERLPAQPSMLLPVLPKGKVFPAGSQEQMQALARTVPEDIGLVLGAPPRPAGNSPAHILFAVLFFGAIALLCWHFFPRELPPPSPPDTISEIPAERLPKADPFSELAIEAERLHQEGHFAECADRLKPHIQEWCRTAEYPRLLWLFFDSVRKGTVPQGLRQDALAWARILMRGDPDTLAWTLFFLHLRAESLLDYSQLHRSILTGNYAGLPGRLAKARGVLRESLPIATQAIRGRRRILRDEKDAKLRQQHLEELLQLQEIKASLLTAQWMLDSGNGTADFQDDEGDPGVAEREEALAITLQPAPGVSGKDIPANFVQLRLFIAQIVHDQAVGITNRFYWNRKTHYTRAELQQQMEQWRAQLANSQGGRP